MRLPDLDPAHLTPEQQVIWDRVASGPRGGVRGPYFALLQSPQLCEEFERLGRYLRYDCAVPHHLRELSILVVARRWKAQYEWFAHAPIAAKAGIPAAVIEAIRTGAAPAFESEDTRVVYEYVHELLANGRVGEARHQAALKLLGVRGIVDLVSFVGHYGNIALTLNAFEIGIPPGNPLPFPE
jgi:4-carboxymuconolactone decarboxylase